MIHPDPDLLALRAAEDRRMGRLLLGGGLLLLSAAVFLTAVLVDGFTSGAAHLMEGALGRGATYTAGAWVGAAALIGSAGRLIRRGMQRA